MEIKTWTFKQCFQNPKNLKCSVKLTGLQVCCVLFRKGNSWRYAIDLQKIFSADNYPDVPTAKSAAIVRVIELLEKLKESK